MSTSSCWILTSIWCGASFGELDASLQTFSSSVSLLQNPTALTCPNARSTLTDRLACLRGGGGKRGRMWMEKNPHPPTGRQGALTERNSSSFSFFFRAGRYRVPFSTSSLLLPNSEFQGPPDSDLWTPRRSILPPFKRRRRTPPHTHTRTRTLLQTLANVRPPRLKTIMEEQERPQRIYWASHVALEEDCTEKEASWDLRRLW